MSAITQRLASLGMWLTRRFGSVRPGGESVEIAREIIYVKSGMTVDDWLNNWDLISYVSGPTVFFCRTQEGISCSIKGRRGSTEISSMADGKDSITAFLHAVVEAEKTICSDWRKGLSFSPLPLLVGPEGIEP